MELPLLALGAVTASAVHVLTGPDHLAAVLPYAVADRRRAFSVGAAWGLGHGLGVVTLGLVGLALRARVDLDALSGAAELAVGALLIFVGLRTLRQSRLLVVHGHAHPHGAEDQGHSHVHLHIGDTTVHEPEHAVLGEHTRHRHSAFGFGILHGAAGGGHLLGALPAMALAPADAAVYLLAYGVTALVTMGAFAAGAGALVREAQLSRALAVAGGLSLSVGVLWVGMAVLG